MEQFKVGNFVRHKILRTAHKCTSINEGEFSNKISTVPSISFDSEYMNQYELWFPEPGEWVIPDTGVNEDMFVVMKYNGVSLIPNRCEPYIGELPSDLKG